MPVPVRDDGSAGPTKHLLLFVHGFCSDHTTWDPMLRCLRHDAQMSARYDVETVDYKTAPVALPVVRRLPKVKEIGAYLDETFRALMYDPQTGENRYINATLIGHSMGGLAIKAMLTGMLDARRGHEFAFIRQAIFFATPHLGSMTLEGFRGFLGKLISNPQEEILRGFNEEITQLHHRTLTHITRAKRRDADEYPLPMTAFWGMEDNIVAPHSAQGLLDVAFPLPGSHVQVHCPTDDVPDAYRALVSALEHPHGHSSIFEIEQFRYCAKVKPLPPGTTRTVSLPHRTRDVVTDNEALVTREVTFSRHNTCRDDFELKYRTNDAGHIDPLIRPSVEMRPDHRSAYCASGTAVNYGVPAKAGAKYALNMTVLNGFSIGNRDFHQHFTNRCYFRRVRFELDLTAYLSAGWHITDTPRLYYHATDSDDHALCKSRAWCTPDPASGHQAEGKWMWELEFITNGVLDLTWDLAQ
jgi:pimeloyl-ACP methyl ester carboxylesterase